MRRKMLATILSVTLVAGMFSAAPVSAAKKEALNSQKAGLYDNKTKKMLQTWNQLIRKEQIKVSKKSVITKVKKIKGTLVIKKGIKGIGKYAFQYSDGLKKIIIPESVVNIGEWAFNQCQGITSIEIPKGVVKIGDYAFADCLGLKTVKISEGVKKIGECAFDKNYDITSVTIPASVTSIGDMAFHGDMTGSNNVKDVYYGGTKRMWQNLMKRAKYKGKYIFGSSKPTIHYK